MKNQIKNDKNNDESELTNDLIGKAQEKQLFIQKITAELEKGESSGFTNLSKEQILAKAKSLLR